MEKEMIYDMFCRSLPKYYVRYVSYIGNGNAIVHSYLTSHPPYPGVVVKKLEDSNHFAKQMLNRIKRIKQENKGQLLLDGKRFSGKRRMSDAHAVQFKIYITKAICESKSDLDKPYKRSWTIFKHHYSTDREPMDDWYDRQCCKYLQAKLNGRPYYHNSQSNIPQTCLDAIKPVFHELYSQTSLARMIGGGSQDANEIFHLLLWMMAPKHRFYSSTILRTALGPSAIIDNDSYESLEKLFVELFSSVGYYYAERFSRLGATRTSYDSKVVKRRSRTRTTNEATIATPTDISSSESNGAMLLIPNGKGSLDITQDIMALKLTNDDTNSDYEPGGSE